MPPKIFGADGIRGTTNSRYVGHAKATLQKGTRLDGLRVVLDCANGAAFKVAPETLWELGAEVIALGVSPDGSNVNVECGANPSCSIFAVFARLDDDRPPFDLVAASRGEEPPVPHGGAWDESSGSSVVCPRKRMRMKLLYDAI
jgi:hypothetical protein